MCLEEGSPSIFNTDQGSQFTCDDFTHVLLDRGIRVSMDGRGRYLDNIFCRTFMTYYQSGRSLLTGLRYCDRGSVLSWPLF